MLGFGPLAFRSLTQPSAVTSVFVAATGFFKLSGFPAGVEITPRQLPMATRRDFWDVDEWGKFMPGSGTRYTL